MYVTRNSVMSMEDRQMDVTVNARIGRVAGELAEIEDRGAAHFGFGVFKRSDTGMACNSRVVQAIKRFLSQKPGNMVRLQPSPWVSPSPSGECHIRWWGDRAGINAFEPWVGRFVALLSRLPDHRAYCRIPTEGHSNLVVVKPESEADFTPPRHPHDALLALVRFAAEQEGLKPSVEVSAGEDGCFYDVKPRAIRFVRAVAEHVQAGPTARLIVNTVTNSVTFDGQTTFPELSWIRVLSLLQEAKGQPMSRRDLQISEKRMYPTQYVLEAEERLDRTVIEPIRTKLGIPIQSSKKGYWLPADCWQED
jgi:hypothetical protein